MSADEKFYTLLETLGARVLAEALNSAFRTDEAHEFYDYIARMYVIDFDED